MPTMCEIPDPKRPDLGKWKVVICVDEKENGKNGAKLKIGQRCAVVQGLDYEVRGTSIPNGRRDCHRRSDLFSRRARSPLQRRLRGEGRHRVLERRHPRDGHRPDPRCVVVLCARHSSAQHTAVLVALSLRSRNPYLCILLDVKFCGV